MLGDCRQRPERVQQRQEGRHDQHHAAQAEADMQATQERATCAPERRQLFVKIRGG